MEYYSVSQLFVQTAIFGVSQLFVFFDTKNSTSSYLDKLWGSGFNWTSTTTQSQLPRSTPHRKRKTWKEKHETSRWKNPGAVRYDGQYHGPLSSSRLNMKSDGELLSVVGGELPKEDLVVVVILITPLHLTFKIVKKILQLVKSMLPSPHPTKAFYPVEGRFREGALVKSIVEWKIYKERIGNSTVGK